ncbi:MAG TPA: methionine--tRNA ligase [Firmicutes bacterium]|nr:methionine--tRNA ligase [Bacillota bacterium]
MAKPTYYLTTPLYYTSGRLHIGHAYTSIIADAVARYKRLRGYNVCLLTGTDEHGQKIQRSAEAAGKQPQEFVDGLVASIKDLWQLLDVDYDVFIRTTDKHHKQAVQGIFEKLYNQGDIYKSEYQGWYCEPCEAFFTERQLKEGKCPDCGRDVEWLKEESYFFKLSKYQDRLLKYIEEHPEFIQPASRRNEMINTFIKPGLEDLCVSRTTFDWGVRVPFDPKHVVYVWLDALSNYITALGYGSADDSAFRRYWPADVHLVGKEIVRFHTIIWPILLMALDLPLPKQVFGHGWLLFDDDKMSKSKGNVVDPVPLVARYGSDALRYYLLREIAFGADGNFTQELFITRINADLANDLGNLLSRTVAMIEKYFGGQTPAPEAATDFDQSLLALAAETKGQVEQAMDNLRPQVALEAIWQLVKRANKYIDETMPWVLAKEDSKRPQLATVLYNLADVLRLTAVLLQPFMPRTPQRIWKQLGLEANQEAQWEQAVPGGLAAGKQVKKGEPIFPRLDLKAELAAWDGEGQKEEIKPLSPPLAEEVDIELFSKIDLRVVTVLEAEKVPKADRLLKLRVALGSEQRTIVAGVAQHYQPEELVGKQVVIVANLKPAKIRGIESQGMILAASDENGLAVLTPQRPVEAGSKAK